MNIAEQVTQLKKDFDEVYEAGRAAGGDTDAAYQQGVTDGKKAEYDKTWDIIQENGNRTDYALAFQGYTFNALNFYPKYDMRPEGSAEKMFYGWSNKHSTNYKLDVAARLEECGVVLDTSKVTVATDMFSYGTPFTRLPAIDLRNTTNSTNVFSNTFSTLVTIDKVIVAETVTYSNWFTNVRGLTTITFDGVIGQSINFQWSTSLSKVSIKNIIEHLSTTASGQTLTLSKTAVTNAFGSTTADEWTALITTKPNWTITLV